MINKNGPALSRSIGWGNEEKSEKPRRRFISSRGELKPSQFEDGSAHSRAAHVELSRMPRRCDRMVRWAPRLYLGRTFSFSRLSHFSGRIRIGVGQPWFARVAHRMLSISPRNAPVVTGLHSTQCQSQSRCFRSPRTTCSRGRLIGGWR